MRKMGDMNYKEFFKSTPVYFCLLVVLTIPLCLNLLGDHLIQGHDSLAGLIRAICMERYLGEGQFLIRWSSDVNFGYGSPMFDFYPPFFYYVVLLLSKVTQNIILAINLTCAIFWILSGIGIYLFAREFWGNKGGFLSAILYIYSPYYVQDFYVRGAFSEFSTFMIFPFLLLSIYKINQKVQIRYILLGTVSALAAILTHGMGMFFIIIALFYVLLLFLLNKNRRAFFLGISILLLGLMMSSFYWLPALWETKYLNLNFLISMRYDFHKNFISLAKLLCVPWDRTKDIDSLSLQIGTMQLILLFLSLLIPLRIFRKNSSIVMHYFFFLIVGFIAVVLTLPVSKILWEHMNILRFIQLPWRFLTIVAFAVSLLAGSSVMLIRRGSVSLLFLGVVTFLIVLSPIRYYSSGNFKIIDQADVKKNLSNYAFLGEGERTPKWIKVPLLVAPSHKFEIVWGSGQFSHYRSNNPIDHLVQVVANQPLLACFHTFYFPGWQVYIDKKETKIYPNNIYGLILFAVPLGEHTVRVIFGPTPIHIAGMMISWMGVILLLGGILASRMLTSRQ